MKIGLDYHGVIDVEPEFFSYITGQLITKGNEIHIITGHEETEEFKDNLKKLGIQWTHFFSITSHHKLPEIDTEVVYRNGTPWMNNEIWNNSKAEYCKTEMIDFLIDDSPVYAKYFYGLYTTYIDFRVFKLMREMITI